MANPFMTPLPANFNPSATAAPVPAATPGITPAPQPKPIAPTSSVVTSAPAQADQQNIQNTLTTAKTGIQTQAQTVAQNQAVQQQQQQAQAQQDLQNKQAQQALDIKQSTVNAATAGPTRQVTAPDGSILTVDNSNDMIVGSNTNGTTNYIGQPIAQVVPSAQSGNEFPLNQPTPGSDLNAQSQESYQAAQDAASKIYAYSQGTVPLTPMEQAQVDNLKQSFNTLIEQQQRANAVQQGLATETAARRGQEYTPEISGGIIGNVVNTGIQKLGALNSQMTDALTKMEQGFISNDIAAVRDANTTYQTAANARLTFLQEQNKQITDQAASLRDFTQKVAQDNITNNLNQENFDLKKTQDAIDNAFKQGQITETQRHDMADEANTRATEQIAAAHLSLDQATFNATIGQFVNSNGTTNTSVDPTQIPGFTKLGNGAAIIDSTNFPKGITRSQIGGVPVVDGKDVPLVTTASNLLPQINQAQALFNKLQNGAGGSVAPNIQDVSSYNNLVNSINSSLSDLGKDNRFSAVGPANTSAKLPAYGSAFWSAATTNLTNANSQFNTVRNSLNTGLKNTVQNFNPPPYGQIFQHPADAQAFFNSTGNGNEFTNAVDKANAFAQQEFGRDANAGEIMQVINGN